MKRRGTSASPVVPEQGHRHWPLAGLVRVHSTVHTMPQFKTQKTLPLIPSREETMRIHSDMEKSRSTSVMTDWRQHTRLKICIGIFLLLIIIIFIALGAAGVFRSKPTHCTDNCYLGSLGSNLTGNGDGTFYNPDVGIGACGWQNYSDQYIAAMVSQKTLSDLI